MTRLEDLVGRLGGKTHEVTFLPDPEPNPRRYTIISVDDHLVEPRETFQGRLPSKFDDVAPRIVELEDGSEVWKWEDRIIPNAGANAVVGRPPTEYSMEPSRFDHMRRGAWDVNERIRDMDLGGIWASICFPSMVAGFAGARFAEAKDPELGLACVKAWNDWHIEEWCGAYPDRLIPQQVTWLRDAELAAAEVRRNAARGVHAVSFPELPDKLGLPTINSGYWDPFLRACEETDTVISLHVGSGSWVVDGSEDAPPEVQVSLFFVSSIIATSDWLFSKAPVRFPNLKIALSEGGIGWVPALIDRIEHCFRYKEFTGSWVGEELHPLDVLRRNFWFCALDDTAGFEVLDTTGPDRVMVECDYPHADSTWPNTQDYLQRQLGFLPAETIEKLTWRNASELFRFPVADSVHAWRNEVPVAV